MAQVVDVFIASPSDVKQERKHAEDVIGHISKKTRELLNIVLNPVSWPNFLPSATKCSTERVQDRFTSRVRKCGIFIGILYQRYGTEIDDTRSISGTEEEFNKALEHQQTIELLTYFRHIPESIKSDKLMVAQLSKLQDLQDRLMKAGIFPSRYRNPSNFRERFILDLFEAVVKIRTEAERGEQLSSFFRFGVSIKRESPSVLLGYPPIHKHFHNPMPLKTHVTTKRQPKYTYNWQQRLLPNVVYEDVKCIQKIESAVRLTGVLDISSVTIDHPRISTEQGNRIWLCLPRNDIASRRLAELGSRAYFKFESMPGEDRPYIIWNQKGKTSLEIKSPMARYLELQKRPKRSVWDPKFGAIVAKDYAVIGRFAKPGSKGLTRNDPYYHYFIAGIRGLGTWGAGWFIERRADDLQQIVNVSEANSDDVQVLLEVTFSNYRIISVEDVSNKDKDYFKTQNEDAVINSIIDQIK